MANIFRKLLGTTARYFSIGSPAAPEIVLGTNIYDVYTVTSTTASITPTWWTYRTWNTPVIQAGTYELWWSFLWGHNTANRSVNFQVLVDGTPLTWLCQERNTVAGGSRYPVCAFVPNIALTAATHAITIQANNQTGGTLSMFQNTFKLMRLK